MLAETNFFQRIFVLRFDLSQKIGKSWALLIKVPISLRCMLLTELVGRGAYGWVEPILFVSATDSFLSLKVLKLYNQCPERSGISTICSKSVFRKAIEKYSKNVSNFSSCYSKLFLFCFVLFWRRDKYQRNENFNCFIPVTKTDKVYTTSTFLRGEKILNTPLGASLYIFSKNPIYRMLM